MKDEIIINGVTYVRKEENKEFSTTQNTPTSKYSDEYLDSLWQKILGNNLEEEPSLCLKKVKRK